MRLLLTYGFFLFGWMISGLSNVNAQSSFTAAVNQNPIPVNRNFQYSLTLKNQKGSIYQPQFGELQLIGGPSTGQNTRIVNGKRDTEYTYTWVLRAVKPGKYTIDPGKAQVNGVVIQSNAITIEVTKGTESSGSLQSNANLQVDVELSQRSAYVGEQIIAVYKLYSRFPDLRFESIKYPGMDGFWTETIEEDMIEWEPQLKLVNGVQYRVAVLKTEVIYPQRAGKLTIDPVQLEALGKKSFFDRYQKMVATSRPVSVEVKALPPAPAGQFLGTFDKLSMEVKIDKEQLPANEAATLSMKFSGRGNLKLLDAPEPDFPADLEVFDPKREDRISINAGGMAGNRTYEYVIIPRTQGTYDISALNLVWFDSGANAYKSLNTGDIRLTVSKGTGDGGSYTYNSKTDVSILNTDIRFIITDASQLNPTKNRFFGSMLYYGLSILPILAFGLFWVRKKREEDMKSNPGEWKMKQAGKVARKHLSEAEKLLQSGDAQQFYGELLRALQGYLNDKFNISMSELSEKSIAEKLSGKLDDAVIQRIKDLMMKAEMARYAGLGEGDKEQALEQAKSLIQEIERTSK